MGMGAREMSHKAKPYQMAQNRQILQTMRSLWSLEWVKIVEPIFDPNLEIKRGGTFVTNFRKFCHPEFILPHSGGFL